MPWSSGRAAAASSAAYASAAASASPPYGPSEAGMACTRAGVERHGVEQGLPGLGVVAVRVALRQEPLVAPPEVQPGQSMASRAGGGGERRQQRVAVAAPVSTTEAVPRAACASTSRVTSRAAAASASSSLSRWTKTSGGRHLPAAFSAEPAEPEERTSRKSRGRRRPSCAVLAPTALARRRPRSAPHPGRTAAGAGAGAGAAGVGCAGSAVILLTPKLHRFRVHLVRVEPAQFLGEQLGRGRAGAAPRAGRAGRGRPVRRARRRGGPCRSAPSAVSGGRR